MIKQRKDINTLSAGELSDYIHALDILRARSEIDEDDPTGYAFQAALHNDGFVGPCEHGNDQFLPWHRAHLYYFEQLLQGADPPRTANVTIPYWDWLHRETSGKFPAAFGGPGLFKPGRNVVAADLPPDTLIIVTGEMDWNEFGGYPKGSPTGDYGRLEDGPHNDMHGSYIGGDMASPNLAARDAIYFSFHGFIDLMWSEWQQRNGMPPPTSPTADLRGFLTQTLHKVQDFQRTTGLGYEYEYTDQLKAAFAVTVPAPVKRSLVGTERLRSLSEGGLEADLQEKEWTQFAFPPVSERAMATMVRLQDLRVPRGGSYKLNVYVHPNNVPFTKDASFADRFLVGYVALWQMHPGHAGHADHPHGNGHPMPQPLHPVSCTKRFDVTRALANAGADAADVVLTLQYIPAPSPTGEPSPDPEILQQVTLDAVVMEVFA